MASICFIMRCMSISFLSVASNAGPFCRSFGVGGGARKHDPRSVSYSSRHRKAVTAARFMASPEVKSASAMSVSRSETMSSHALCIVLHSTPHFP